jgi:hypothetical protein
MSVTFRHLLSPILRRWCTSSSSSSSSHCVNNSERYELKGATLNAAKHDECDVDNCDAESNGDCEEVGSKHGTKENEFSEIENGKNKKKFDGKSRNGDFKFFIFVSEICLPI